LREHFSNSFNLFRLWNHPSSILITSIYLLEKSSSLPVISSSILNISKSKLYSRKPTCDVIKLSHYPARIFNSISILSLAPLISIGIYLLVSLLQFSSVLSENNSHRLLSSLFSILVCTYQWNCTWNKWIRLLIL
jgi:hypothetical protein